MLTDPNRTTEVSNIRFCGCHGVRYGCIDSRSCRLRTGTCFRLEMPHYSVFFQISVTLFKQIWLQHHRLATRQEIRTITRWLRRLMALMARFRRGMLNPD